MSNKLTDREKEVMRLAWQGLGNKGIGKVLMISPRTVCVHMSNIYIKTQLKKRAQIPLFVKNNPSIIF